MPFTIHVYMQTFISKPGRTIPGGPQVKAQGEHVLEERRLTEAGMESVTQELALTKQAFRDVTRREKQVCG